MRVFFVIQTLIGRPKVFRQIAHLCPDIVAQEVGLDTGLYAHLLRLFQCQVRVTAVNELLRVSHNCVVRAEVAEEQMHLRAGG